MSLMKLKSKTEPKYFSKSFEPKQREPLPEIIEEKTKNPINSSSSLQIGDGVTITGTIKANFPTRISFQVTSKIDSRTILGEQGAEQLLGKGDMLYMSSANRIVRIHAPYVSENEIEKINNFLRAQAEPDYFDEILNFADEKNVGSKSEDNENQDELYNDALEIIKTERKASTSFLQRKLQIGYNRAARIIDQMEANGEVSKANHVGKREVLK